MIIDFNTVEKRESIMSDEIKDSQKPLLVLPPHSSEPTPEQPPYVPKQAPIQPPHPPEQVPMQSQQILTPPPAGKGKLWENSMIVGIVTSIISILLTLFVTNILPGVYQTPIQIAELRKDIESLEQEIQRESDNRSNDIRYLQQSTSEHIQELWIQINGISQKLGMPVNLYPTDEMKTAITNDYVLSSLNVSGNTELRATATIAYSVVTGQEYTVDQLASQKLLLPYMSGSQEVYFYGQLSDEGRWDGHCIINVYENNK